MSTEVRNLEPKILWNHFADLNAVPRPSKKEERVIQFMVDFGKKLGLPTIVDEVGNVIITKPATPGLEDRTTVVLQSHLDMVHQKNADTDFDFDKEGIKMYVDGDWVKARGTTLGSDNGIGVASIMSLLSSNEIQHPPLEALFTIDEETGMTGAMGLKGGLLKAGIMLNLDTEDDTDLTIGCAGGIDVTASGFYQSESLPETGMKAYAISVKGLSGGHSGMDIHLGKGNANKLMNRILFQASEKFGLRIHSVDGGGLRNAIPRESFAIVALPENKIRAFEPFFKAEAATIAKEYATTDPETDISLQSNKWPGSFLPIAFQGNILRSIYACPNGIHRMSPDIAELVQTSNNLARVLIQKGQYQMLCLTRSAVDSEKHDLANAIQSTFELSGANVELGGSYPGWAPKPEAAIVKLMSTLYQDFFGQAAHVNACHAGLECGILGKNYPDMDMISFGPNIRGPHSPDEKCQISSVKKYWGFLLATLKQIPKAG